MSDEFTSQMENNLDAISNGQKTKKEVLASNNRVSIETPSLQGSINLKGAIIDDLILLNYKESLDKNSKNINLLLPDQTANPFMLS